MNQAGRVALAMAAFAVALPALAQARSNSRSVAGTANAVSSPAPSMSGTSASGLRSPVPAGLPSPMPSPSGLALPPSLDLRSTAGTNSAGSFPAPTAGGGVNYDGGTPPQTNAMGAGGDVMSGQRGFAPSAYGYGAADIARAFMMADTNHDGELSRLEAQRLPIGPIDFDALDRNHDGVLSRFEYDDAFR